MSVYLRSVDRIFDPSRNVYVREVREYFVDTDDDMLELAAQPQISTASTALVLDTGDVYVNTDTGWRKI